MQIAGYLTRATAHVARRAGIPYVRGKSIEQLPVERFMLQFIEDAAYVFIGYKIVTALIVGAFISVHQDFFESPIARFSSMRLASIN